MFLAEQLVSFCTALLGMPYWYGTCGYKCTEDLLKRKANQYPTHYTSSRMSKYRQAIADKKVCVDCIGMIKAFFWTNGGQGIIDYINGTGDYKSVYASNGMPDKSANGFLSWLKGKGCKHGSINTIPEEPGITVFSPGHVGLYIGNGYVIEARGFNYGVVKTKLKNRPWKEWAYLPESLITYPSVKDEPEKKSTLGSRNLLLKSSRMRGDDVKELQEKLNSIGYDCGEVDGIFGKKTDAGVRSFQRAMNITIDGVFGKNSYKCLLTALKER